MGYMWNGNQMVFVPDGTMNAMGNIPPMGNPQMGGQMPYNGYQGQPMNGFQGQQQASTNANNSVQPQTNIVRVHGLDEAKKYPLPNNYIAMLYDNEKDLAYYVKVDGTGKREVVTMELSEHKDEPPIDYSTFATKDDIEELRKEFASNKTPKKNIVSGE